MEEYRGHTIEATDLGRGVVKVSIDGRRARRDFLTVNDAQRWARRRLDLRARGNTRTQVGGGDWWHAEGFEERWREAFADYYEALA